MNKNEIPVARQLAQVGVKLNYEDIDSKTISNAKIFLLDCLGCILGAKNVESAKVIYKTVREIGGKPESTIIGYGDKTSPMMAALCNATTGHSQDFDDDHREGTQHSSVAVLPAVLAIGEQLGLTGKEILTAYIYGSDITIRLGEAFLGKTYYLGFHPTGTCGVFGAAGGVGKALGLNEQDLTMCIGIAGSQASGITEFNKEGAWTKRFHPGHAAMGGILAAYMARNGYTGPTTIFEGENGFLKAYSYKGEYDINKIIDGFGKRWEMADNSIKLHSCCRFSCNLADCAIDIFKQGINPEDIESIHAEANNFTIKTLCSPEDIKRHPKNTVNAQFSLAWAIAVGLVKGKVLVTSFTEEALRDQLFYDLCEKTTWEVNPEFEAVYPKYYPARVTVKTKSGKTYVGEVKYPKGDPENPATKEEVNEKFRFNAAFTIGSDKAEKVIELVDKFETLPNINELMANLY
jgi:2-methylcitrate dehydratase PrpD